MKSDCLLRLWKLSPGRGWAQGWGRDTSDYIDNLSLGFGFGFDDGFGSALAEVCQNLVEIEQVVEAVETFPGTGTGRDGYGVWDTSDYIDNLSLGFGFGFGDGFGSALAEVCQNGMNFYM